MPRPQRLVAAGDSDAAREIISRAAWHHQQGNSRVGQRRQHPVHRAVAAKNNGHVRQVVRLQRIAPEDVDARIAESIHDVSLQIGM
jgi:hypothetical protein